MVPIEGTMPLLRSCRSVRCVVWVVLWDRTEVGCDQGTAQRGQDSDAIIRQARARMSIDHKTCRSLQPRETNFQSSKSKENCEKEDDRLTMQILNFITHLHCLLLLAGTWGLSLRHLQGSSHSSHTPNHASPSAMIKPFFISRV